MPLFCHSILMGVNYAGIPSQIEEWQGVPAGFRDSRSKVEIQDRDPSLYQSLNSDDSFKNCTILQKTYKSAQEIPVKIQRVKMMRSSLRLVRDVTRVRRAVSLSASKSLSTAANSITLDLGNVFSTHRESFDCNFSVGTNLLSRRDD